MSLRSWLSAVAIASHELIGPSADCKLEDVSTRTAPWPRPSLPLSSGSPLLRKEIQLSLVADPEDAHLGAMGHESVERQVARLPERNDELPDVAVAYTADQRVVREDGHCATNGGR